jgi:hypothetical protein
LSTFNAFAVRFAPKVEFEETRQVGCIALVSTATVLFDKTATIGALICTGQTL